MKFLTVIVLLFSASTAFSNELEWMPKLYSCTDPVNGSARYDIHVEVDNDSLIIAQYENELLVRKLLSYHADGIHAVNYEYEILGFRATYTTENFGKVTGGALRLEKVNSKSERVATLSLLEGDAKINNLYLDCKAPVEVYWGNSMVLLNDYAFKLAVPAQLLRKCPNAFRDGREVEIAQEAVVSVNGENKTYKVSFESFNSDGSLAQKFKTEILSRSCRYCSFYIQKATCR